MDGPNTDLGSYLRMLVYTMCTHAVVLRRIKLSEGFGARTRMTPHANKGGDYQAGLYAFELNIDAFNACLDKVQRMPGFPVHAPQQRAHLMTCLLPAMRAVFDGMGASEQEGLINMASDSQVVANIIATCFTGTVGRRARACR